MASSIGIKIANGEFYPILEENSLIKKRLILTTVHDNQQSVQIDLFRSAENLMTEAQYIGSLVVDNIETKTKGEPSIELVISSDKNGEIVANAVDLDTGKGGEHHILTVSLHSIDESSRDIDLPDFELEANEEPPSGLYTNAGKIRKKKKKSSLWIFIIIGLVIILGLAAAWLFFFGGLETVTPKLKTVNTKLKEVTSGLTLPEFIKKKPAVKPNPVKEPEPKVEKTPEPIIEKAPEPIVEKTPEPIVQEPVIVVEPPPVIKAPDEPPPPRQQTTASKRPPPPVASYKVPSVIPKQGVDYRIRYGDTLWDIADAFYRNPWLYPRIARHNNIRNPNYIISGRIIRIPPKN